MSKTTAPKTTPSPTGGESTTSDKARRDRSPRAQFALAALDMSWQLAVVVLVPLLGGFKLDEKYNSSPVLTLIGFGLAMVGTAVVLWRVSQTLGAMQLPTPHKGAK
jgi:F0F1-type ATP synthase assembly protein I